MSWRDKDDLDLTADDLDEVLAKGTPVEIVSGIRTVAVSYRPESALGWSPTVSSPGTPLAGDGPLTYTDPTRVAGDLDQRLQPA